MNARTTITLTLAFALSLAAPALADQHPIWVAPADLVTVVSVGTTNGLTFAMVRDNGMRGHNLFCVTQGAHIGKATITRIGTDGVELSDGRMLRADLAASVRVEPVLPASAASTVSGS